MRIITQIILLCILAFTPTQSFALLIDDFNTDQGFSVTSDGINRASSGGEIYEPTSIGGHRYLELGSTSEAEILAYVDSGAGTFYLSCPFGAAESDSIDLTFIWDGTNSVGLGSQDLTEGGVQNALIISGFTDLDGDVVFTLADGSSNTAAVTNALTGGFSGQLAYRFSDFIGVDMTDIESIKLEVFGFGPIDFQADFLASSWVPEADVRTLILCFLVPFLGLRARNKAKASA